jgi:multidrug efflux pump subunit AcrA (membrane-fusion protein)
VIVLSQELVQEEVGGRQYVMTMEESADGPVARKSYVRTGESYEGDVIITSGVEVGQKVILEGSRGLAPGEGIEIVKGEIAADDK